MKIFVALFTLIPSVFLGIGVYLAWSQQHKITTYQPIEATVLSKRVEQHTSTDSDGTSTTYKPVVEYRYVVDGAAYQFDEVYPMTLSAGSRWARETINQFSVDQVTTAYYDPSNPAQAFLLKQYTFFPYLFILFPMLFYAVAVFMGVAVGASIKRPPPPQPRGGNRYELVPRMPIARRMLAALIIAVGWYVVGLLASGHYFYVAFSPYETMATVCTSIYSLLGFIPLGMAIYYFKLGRQVSDAITFVNATRFSPGDKINIHAEQQIFADLFIEEFSVGLVCEETTRRRSGSKTTISSHTCYEKRVGFYKQHESRTLETLTATETLQIPAGSNPTSLPGQKEYPRYVWRVEVQTKIDRAPDYRGKFPIMVGSSSEKLQPLNP